MCSHVESRKLNKPLTDCRVCVIVRNPRKPSSCLDEVIKTSRQKVFYCFYKKFLKNKREILNIKLFSVDKLYL